MVKWGNRPAAWLVCLGLVAALVSCSAAPTAAPPREESAVTGTAAPTAAPPRGVSASPGTAAPTTAPPRGVPASPGTTAETRTKAARAHLEELAKGIGGRYPGTPAEQRAGDYVRSAFERLGYAVETQPFAFGRRRTSANLVATKDGVSSRELVVGAHYDSDDEGDGADDNASGVGVLLAAAEAVRDLKTPYTIRFVAFGAEESDLDGSGHYVDQLDGRARANVVAMVNFDSVSAGDIPYVYGDAADLREWVREVAAASGQPMETMPVSSLHSDADYYPFQRAGIPFIYFEATNWNLGSRDGFTQVDQRYADEGAIIHTRYDTLRYLDDTFPGRVDERLRLYTTVVTSLLTDYRA